MPAPKYPQDPTLPQGFSITFRKRFWKHINKTDTCWLWTAVLTGHGYGNISCGGKGSAIIPAHRASWIIHYGTVAPDMCVLHRCDVRKCVRPEHLFLGTKGDNAADAISKGRHTFGERVGNHKLSESDVIQIKTLLSDGQLTQWDIADRFGVRQGTISDIRRGNIWKHVVHN